MFEAVCIRVSLVESSSVFIEVRIMLLLLLLMVSLLLLLLIVRCRSAINGDIVVADDNSPFSKTTPSLFVSDGLDELFLSFFRFIVGEPRFLGEGDVTGDVRLCSVVFCAASPFVDDEFVVVELLCCFWICSRRFSCSCSSCCL